MYSVTVQNPCSCFFKSSLVESQEFNTRDEAKKEAEKMVETMSNTFCQKHNFRVIEQGLEYIVMVSKA